MARLLNRLRRFSPLLGLLLLVLLGSQVDLQQAWQMAHSLSLNAVIAAAAVYAANVLLKAVRWHRMLRQQRIHIALGVSVAAFLSGAFYGMLTIGRLGELLRIEAILEQSASKGRALASCVADRLLDVAFLGGAAGVAAVVALGYPVERALAWFGLGALGTLAVASVFWWSRQRAAAGESAVANGLAARLERYPRLMRLIGGSRELLLGVLELLFTVGVLEALLWTAVSWLGYFLAVHFLGVGLGLQVPFLATVAASAVGAASAALPISFQGVGTREVAFALVMAPYGVSATQAMTLSVVTLGLLYLVTLPLGGYGVWLRRRQIAAQPAAVGSQP